MPYEPNPRPSREEARALHRERLYWLTLLTGLANLALLAMHVAGASIALEGWLVGGVTGSLLVAGFRGHTDDYYNQLVGTGMRLMTFGIGILLLLTWMQQETSLVSRLVPGFDRLAGDGFLLMLSLGLLFHAGYAFAYLRDRWTARSDEE